MMQRIGLSSHPNVYLPRPAELTRIERLTPSEKVFELKLCDGSELGHRPGQFVEVSCFGIGEAPISISSSPTQKGYFELAVRSAGDVTKFMHQLETGARVGIRGPFGNGFPLDYITGRDILFVAGGIGLFPLRSLINYVLAKRNLFGRVMILFGARRPAEQVFVSELALWRGTKELEYHETVDRGDDTWKGNVGVITTLFPKVEINPEKAVAVIVGPPIMYRFAVIECLKKGISEDNIIVSLERRMKCGIGRCGHCQIDNVYVCQDGPVFTYARLKTMREAM
jgi:sulfite reductase subunit B